MKSWIGLLLALLPFCPCADESITHEDLEKWFVDDSHFSTEHVNEGKLKFLPEPPKKPVLHSINTLTVSRDSIQSGWVLLDQCYKHLDPVPDAEIVYQYKSIRGLKVTSKRNIANVMVEEQSVQLENIKQNAELCVQAEVRIFYKNPNGTFSLLNGPFHRKFLDGYYPYHVTLRINYPSHLVTLLQTKPAAQVGFDITESMDLILINSYFEGVLNTEILFKLKRK